MINRYANFPSTGIAVYPGQADLKGMLIRLKTDHIHQVYRRLDIPGGGYEEKLVTLHLKRGTTLRVSQLNIYGFIFEIEAAKYGHLHTAEGVTRFRISTTMRDKMGRDAIWVWTPFSIFYADVKIDQRFIKILKDHHSRLQ
jgi:hypothetical protein